ncbi:SRPBCC family protein [Rhodococcus aerolatus]
MDPAPKSGSVVVDTTPEQLYALVSDVTRTGEWSPICRECWWDEGAGPEVGAWFSGRNEVPGRTWETRSQVVAAEPGREFAWQVGGNLVRWAYTMAPAGDGRTELTEHWQFLPDGLAMFRQRYGDDAEREIENRTQAAHDGIPATLAAIKAVAEGTGAEGTSTP